MIGTKPMIYSEKRDPTGLMWIIPYGIRMPQSIIIEEMNEKVLMAYERIRLNQKKVGG